MTLLTFISMTTLLIIEGFLLATIVLQTRSARWMRMSLSLPLSTFTNVLLIFLYTVVHIPLTSLSIIAGHIFLIVLFFGWMKWKVQPEEADILPTTYHRITRKEWPLIGICTIILLSTIIYSFSHAVLLPTFQYDSATNWTMRSEISFDDHAIAFDQNEDRGMAKPQYPFLFHALQITANEGQSQWNDTKANAILWLLSVATFTALFLILKRLKGTTTAIITTASILSIPLLGIHTAQGYGDLNLLQYLLLSLACLAASIESDAHQTKWLMLSGMFVSAAVWTKSEGILTAVLPWFLILAVLWKIKILPFTSIKKPVIVSLLLWLPWPVYAIISGLGLTPHSSDSSLAFHPEGLQEFWPALFSRGSFGIAYYILPILIIIVLWLAYKHSSMIARRQIPTLLWGMILFIVITFTYLFTPNVKYLLNAEAFYRQMMMPAALLILSLAFIIKRTDENITFEDTRNN